MTTPPEPMASEVTDMITDQQEGSLYIYHFLRSFFRLMITVKQAGRMLDSFVYSFFLLKIKTVKDKDEDGTFLPWY